MKFRVRLRAPETLWHVCFVELEAKDENEAETLALNRAKDPDADPLDWEDTCTGEGIDLEDPRASAIYEGHVP